MWRRNAEGKCLDRTEVTDEDALKDATLTTSTVVKRGRRRLSVRPSVSAPGYSPLNYLYRMSLCWLVNALQRQRQLRKPERASSRSTWWWSHWEIPSRSRSSKCCCWRAKSPAPSRTQTMTSSGSGQRPTKSSTDREGLSLSTFLPLSCRYLTTRRVSAQFNPHTFAPRATQVPRICLHVCFQPKSREI